MKKKLINKKQIKVLVCIILIIVELTSIFFCIKSYNNKNLDKYIFGKQGILKSDMFALYVENDDGTYEKTDTFPDFPYVFNMSKSGCIDSYGNKLSDSLLYNEEAKEVTIKTMNSSECYLYYNKPKDAIAIDKLINSGELWDSGLEGDGLRYVGAGTEKVCSYDNGTYYKSISKDTTACPSVIKYIATETGGLQWQAVYSDACPEDNEWITYECTELKNVVIINTEVPDNFICFGTTSASECKANESKYMYRIIGVFPDEQGNQHLKLRKFKQLDEQKKWNDTAADVNWGESTLFTDLNGTGFLGNTSYSYMQDSTWSDKIVEWKWTAVNTKTYSDNGPDYVNGSTMTPANIYLHEMNHSTKTSTVGEWTYSTGKIGLMYASDYVLSLGSDALAITGTTDDNKAKLKTGWLHYTNDGNSSSSSDWTIAREGTIGSNILVWSVTSTGSVYSSSVTRSYGVAPVFYLTSDISIGSGSGTYTNPYIIEKETILDMELSREADKLNIDITKYTNDLSKYCINRSLAINDCEWKKINSDEIEESISGLGIYYVHVVDSKGYIIHRNIEFLENITDYLINNGNLWSSGLEGDGLRYVGTGNYTSDTTPSNFICFGTTSASECKSNENKYMYRIIGIFPDEEGNQHLKLIKFKQIGSYKWYSTDSDINWADSELKAGLNNEYFLNNNDFNYMKSSLWLNKIENWKWTAVNTKTFDGSGGPNYRSGTTMSKIYLHEMNRSTKTSTVGEWTYPTGKIGLMYASDYLFDLGEFALNSNSYPYYLREDFITGWMHQSNNDITFGNSEWTISRVGINGGTYRSIVIDSEGSIGIQVVTNLVAVRPVFYLTTNVYKSGGTGTYTDPYLLK